MRGVTGGGGALRGVFQSGWPECRERAPRRGRGGGGGRGVGGWWGGGGGGGGGRRWRVDAGTGLRSEGFADERQTGCRLGAAAVGRPRMGLEWARWRGRWRRWMSARGRRQTASAWTFLGLWGGEARDARAGGGERSTAGGLGTQRGGGVERGLARGKARGGVPTGCEDGLRGGVGRHCSGDGGGPALGTDCGRRGGRASGRGGRGAPAWRAKPRGDSPKERKCRDDTGTDSALMGRPPARAQLNAGQNRRPRSTWHGTHCNCRLEIVFVNRTPLHGKGGGPLSGDREPTMGGVDAWECFRCTVWWIGARRGQRTRGRRGRRGGLGPERPGRGVGRGAGRAHSNGGCWAAGQGETSG